MRGFLAQQDASNGISGLRDDPIPPFSGTSGSIGIGPLFQMLLALGIVVALIKFAIPKLLKRVAKKKVSEVLPAINVIETATVGAGQIHIIDVRGRTLLLGSTAQSLSLVADLTDEASTATGFPTFSMTSPYDTPGTSFDEMLSRLNRLGR